MNHNFDVVIVGGGTAGLILARELGKSKRKVLLLDRKKELLEFSFNTLASFIDLDKFGLTHNVVAQDIDTISFHSKRMRRNIKSNLYVLDKKQVHIELLNAIDTDFVTIKTGVNIKTIETDELNNYTSVTDQHKEKYTGKIFVDASGTNAVISKEVGLRAKKVKLATGVEYNVKYIGKPNEIHLLMGEVYQGGYGWIFPLKDERAIIGFGTFDDEVVKDLKNRLHKILEIPRIKKLVIKDNDKVEGASIPITPVLEKFVLNNLVCVGDSVSQVNPIVGEGYKFIFEAALMASKAIEKSLEKDDVNFLNEYELEWKNRFSANYNRSKKTQERFFKYSQNNLLMDYALLLSKFVTDKRAIISLSGEYGLENS
ncbi:NAD(P)/FAD-dependent oxidoreductase [Polaribacter vadi]|uniref:NAD(P)/FAD-dependent oxidoreductase n=1 Tax=Polaribacter vadi TaxID=1774273 RepID=UPI0030EE4F58|tara:strand:+ start:2024 stop:3133 length:1110 start_codon:yes stop_codon:yes gene_type:complete